ncbi:MAG: hypothetical protein MIO92_10740 [Methanosarcinaceae archaeon]|nr:hypothetical protein [Methanosarcinaceae archaeon]
MVRQLGVDPASYDAVFNEDLMRIPCETNGLRLFNPHPVLKRVYKGWLRFKLDPHFNAFANKIIRDFLVEEIF